MNIRNKLSIFGLISLLIWGCNQAPEAPLTIPSIIPKPQQVEALSGRFTFPDKLQLVYPDSLASLGAYLGDWLRTNIGLNLETVADRKADHPAVVLAVAPSAPDHAEGYLLEIDEETIQITGRTQAGLQRGLATFQQLFRAPYPDQGLQLPTLRITDQPRFAWRGLLLDCSRHFMEKDFVKRYIDLLAFHKMNVLHWHITEDQGWRIEIDAYPKLTEIGAWRTNADGSRYGGFYTKDDIREIVAYAAERHITVVPEIEMPGHALAALAAYPQFSCTGGPHAVTPEWGVFKDIYCAGNDSTFIFLQQVLDEVMELFPSKYIHIGGDEAPKYRWENCSKCQRRIQEEGLHDEHELQSWFLNRIGNYLNSKGRHMIGWDEILEGGLPEGATVQSWRGMEGAVKAVKEGHHAILSPTSHAYFDYGLQSIDLEKVYSFEPVPDGLTESEAALILGGECNMWSERAPQELVDSKVFPRILAMAEVLWSDSAGRDFPDLQRRVQEHYLHLDLMDVDYGFEAEPIGIRSNPIAEGLQIELIPGSPQISIRYTLDGSEPNQKSLLYKKEIPVTDVAQLKAKAFFRDKETDESFERVIHNHLATGKDVQLEHPYHKSYTAGGANGLTDGIRGTNAFRDGHWQGFWGHDLVATIDLGEETAISEVSAGFLQYNNAWIFLPTEMIAEVSIDGLQFQSIGKATPVALPKDRTQLTENLRITCDPVTARYVRVVARNLGICPPWHDAAGSEAWIFADEIRVSHAD